ncbi:hypothetical protein [Candidatus Binatus sp.]|uniref:hypothetical protein n=1 Tax=Candidatus Binatus sp. TaxID=2811406 RepID=UPI002F93D833
MTTPTKGIRVVKRRRARSGFIDFADKVTIRDSRDSEIAFVPFFVPRTKGTELSFKIIKIKSDPLREEDRQNEISFSQSEGLKLLDILNGLHPENSAEMR